MKKVWVKINWYQNILSVWNCLVEVFIRKIIGKTQFGFKDKLSGVFAEKLNIAALSVNDDKRLFLVVMTIKNYKQLMV